MNTAQVAFAVNPSFTWDLPSLLSSQQNRPFGLIVLNHEQGSDDVHTRLWRTALLRVAADGGANRLLDAGRSLTDLHVIIGDLDSIRPDVRAHYATTATNIIHDPDQETTDFGKAVRYVRAAFASEAIDIVVFGGLGGRVDHAISQLNHLFLFQQSPTYADGHLFLLSQGNLTFVLKNGCHNIRVRKEVEPRCKVGVSASLTTKPDCSLKEVDVKEEQGLENIAQFKMYVGILPLKGRSIITTQGLEWDVTNWETEMGGKVSTSNHVRPGITNVSVKTTEDVLFTISYVGSEYTEELGWY